MRSERPDRCETCRFWERIDPGRMYEGEKCLMVDDETSLVMLGECRRFPPHLSGSAMLQLGRERMAKSGHANDDHANYHAGEATRFPVTWDHDWCGEWQRIPTPAEPAASQWDSVYLAAYQPEFSARVVNALQQEFCDVGESMTVGRLLTLTANRLLEVRNFGNTCLAEVREKLAANGLKLKGD